MRTCYKMNCYDFITPGHGVMKWLNTSAELLSYTIRMNNPKVAYKVSHSSHNF